MMTGADAEQFSLKWNNFHKNLQSGFHSLFKEVDLVDVTLAAEGQFVQAHKIVLSVCSPYFKQLFKVNPCKHPIVILKDVCHKELIAILQFMYQGEVNVNQEELATFLKTAELLQVKGLTGNDSEMEDDSNENSSPLFQPLPQKRPSSTNLHEVTQIYHDTNKRPHRANDNERVISAPPLIKRMHSELAQKLLSPPVKTNEELETFEIRIPKMETVEIDSDPEVSENSMHEDPLSQLLSSESSHQEMKIGANSDLSNVPGVSQDANNQDIEETQPGTWNSAPRTPRYKIDPPGRLSLDIKRHKLIRIENKGRKLYAQRNCVVCAPHRKRKLTCFKCEFCDAPLHRGECYQRYHTCKNY